MTATARLAESAAQWDAVREAAFAAEADALLADLFPEEER